MNTVLVPDWRISYMAFTAALARRRVELGITQVDLAGHLGTGRRSFQRYEAGEIDPPAMILFQWAAHLGIKIAPHMAHQVPGRAA